MSLEIALLRALLRLARSQRRPRPLASLPEGGTPVWLTDLLVRVDADANAVRRALRSLSRAGLVHYTASEPARPRLTMAGFAVAVATTASPAPRSVASRPKPRPLGKERAARVIPLLRRPAA